MFPLFLYQEDPKLYKFRFLNITVEQDNQGEQDYFSSLSHVLIYEDESAASSPNQPDEDRQAGRVPGCEQPLWHDKQARSRWELIT